MNFALEESYGWRLPDVVEQFLLHSSVHASPVELLPTTRLPIERIIGADESLRAIPSRTVRAYADICPGRGSIDYAFVCPAQEGRKLILAKVGSDERKEQRRTHEKRYALRDAVECLRETLRDDLQAYAIEPCLYLTFGEFTRKRQLQF